MRQLIAQIDAIVNALEDSEPNNDARAWLLREALLTLDRVRSILSALADGE